MNQSTHKNITIAFRVILSGLFFLSAISKLLPIGFFEKMLVDLKVASWDSTVYISRTILSIEFFLAFALLQNSFFKKIIIPATAGLLIVFTGHLFIEGLGNPKGFFEGNCGCFGDLIPLSIFWSIIKNVAMLGMLFYVWKQSPLSSDKKDVKMILIMLFGAVLTTWMMANPIPRYTTYDESETTTEITENITIDTISTETTEDTISVVTPVDTTSEEATKPTKVNIDQSNPKETVKPKDTSEKTNTDQSNQTTTQTTSVKSKFSSFKNFSGGVTTDLDKGRKLVCLYSLTCEHCQACYKELCQWGQKTAIPDMYILAYGAKEDVPYFFEQAGAGCNHPFQIMDYMKFMPLLGDYNFPMIVLMEDGKELGVWDYDTYTFDKVKAAVEKLK